MHLLALSMLQNYNKFETILVFWIYPIYSKFFAFILTFWRNGLSFQLRLFKKKQGERITITSCRLCLTGASWFMCRDIEVSLLAFLTVHAFCIMSHIVDIMNWFGSTSVDKKTTGRGLRNDSLNNSNWHASRTFLFASLTYMTLYYIKI